MDSIWDVKACDRGAALLKEGQPIGTYIRGVCGLWADGRNPRALDAIYHIKGERRAGRPLGATLMAPEFIEWLDKAGIAPSVQDLFFEARTLVTHLGSLCFLRAPVRPGRGASLPARLVSRTADGAYWLQNWLPEGCRPAQAWMESLRKAGLDLPVVTSMNISGEPELVNQEDGLKFCQEHQIPLFLADPISPNRARGSFPILQVNSEGMTLIRAGHFPPKLFQSLAGQWEVDLSSYQSAKLPPVDLPQEIKETAAAPGRLRLRLLAYLDG